MTEKIEQCNFCTRTIDNVDVLYHGVLNANICDICVKNFIMRGAASIINEMSFHEEIVLQGRANNA